MSLSPDSIIDAAGVRAALSHGTPVLDVLPRSSFEEGHLPGAQSLPLAELEVALAQGDARLPSAKDEPLVVYCGGPT